MHVGIDAPCATFSSTNSIASSPSLSLSVPPSLKPPPSFKVARPAQPFFPTTGGTIGLWGYSAEKMKPTGPCQKGSIRAQGTAAGQDGKEGIKGG